MAQEVITPRLQVLSREQMEALHDYSLQILEKTGIRVECPEALKTYSQSDGISVTADRVFIRQEIIEHCLSTAPKNVDLFNRKGEHAFTLGEKQGHNTYFGIGVTNTHFQEINDADVVPFRREHMQICSALGDNLEQFDLVSTLGTPSDVPVHQADLFATLDMYANTLKTLVLLVTKSENLEAGLHLLTELHGDLSGRPFCLPYVNPITPLVLNKGTSDKIQTTIRYGLPLIYSNYGMYGGSTPITEGGTLALLNAELLAGLVYTQLLKPGTPVILGSLPAAFNMRTMGSQYTPTSYLLNLACSEMMAFYRIPHCGTSGSNNGWGADLLAASDLWQNHLLSCLGKVGCAPFVGGTFESLAFSPSMVVLSNQVIKDSRKIIGGFTLNDQSVNLVDIATVGPGGNFFTSIQTLETITIKPENQLWPSLSLDHWVNQDKPTAHKYLLEETQSRYDIASQASKKNKDIIEQGEYIISKLS